MGKVRSKKSSKIARADPTGLSKVENGEDGTEVVGSLGPVSTFVQTNLEQLQSHLAEERDSGLNSLTAASSKPAYLEEILKSDLLKVIGPLLLDPSVSVRHSAAGALRNLSSISMDVCEKLISADVLTPLVNLIKQKYSGEWLPLSKEKRSKQPFKIDSATEAFIESVTLLWNLCETGETALKVFNKEKLGDILIKFLNISTYGIRVSLSSALCLYSATEDNMEAISNPKELEEAVLNLSNLSDDSLEAWQLLYLQTAAAGILLNLNKGNLQNATPTVINLVIGVISKALEVDQLKEISKFSSDVPLENNHAEVYHRESESDLKKVFELDEKCDTLMALISSQVMSLEILSNIITTDDDEYVEPDDEPMTEELDDELVENGEDDVEMKDITDIPEQVYECLTSTGILTNVLAKIKSLPVNVSQILGENEAHGQNILRKCNILRSTALLCLQNLVDVMNLSDLQKCIGIKELWVGLGTLMTESDPSDETMLEAITSAMRAIIQSVLCQKTLSPDATQLCGEYSVFVNVYETTKLPKVKVNVIRIVGGMGLILTRTLPGAPNRPDVDANLLQITELLLRWLTTTKMEREGLWLVAEVLDTTFDMFAEDDFNHILKNIELIQKLRVIQPSFKKQVRNERRSLGENAAVIQTANTNLPRFIQYKEKHGAI